MEPLALSRAEWWEILFFIKKLETKQQHEVNSILQQNLDEQVRRLKDFFGVRIEITGEHRRLLWSLPSGGGAR